eukprot:TRINITY_DN5558_c0_g1_i3.p1 TRINITY_DN5558_c0_g1~~TRINITY_DN5558_c0_g1_i3.p1  ORF type:complete len:352 (-),score=70.31 TRINITY_DN5558_c0_g1_i3:123-1088(-)
MGNIFSSSNNNNNPSSSTPPPPPAAPAPARPSSVRVIPFREIIPTSEAGRGATGVVLKATWRSSPVAVKFFQKGIDDAQYDKEVENLLKISHCPYVVRLFGVCESTTEKGVVMERAIHGSLRDLLTDDSYHFSWPMILMMAIDVCRGMIFVNGENIIHRDLKPENLLVADKTTTARDGVRIKICDFELARAVDVAMTAHVGSRAYTAPELITDTRTAEYNKPCDVYSFSLILWEMITHVVPFSDIDMFHVFGRVRDGDRNLEARPSFVGIQNALENVLGRFERDPHNFPSLTMMRMASPNTTNINPPRAPAPGPAPGGDTA